MTVDSGILLHNAAHVVLILKTDEEVPINFIWFPKIGLEMIIGHALDSMGGTNVDQPFCLSC
jgi:hypothetical protein